MADPRYPVRQNFYGPTANTTQPLTPLEKREGLGSVDLEDRPGGKKVKRGGFWARLR
ncbi:hypothetical protein GP486_008573, partial [Trichoglossum hirsutum]